MKKLKEGVIGKMLIIIIFYYIIITKIDILTYASGYEYYVYERFVGSLNDTGFKGKIFIIIKNIDLNK